VGVGVDVLTSATLLVEGELPPEEKAPLVDTNAPAIAITKNPKMPMSRIGRGLPVDTVAGPLQKRYRRRHADEAGRSVDGPLPRAGDPAPGNVYVGLKYRRYVTSPQR
jgi:hypothetical protein